MKNIHLIPTPEVSRIVLREKDKKIVLHTPITQWHGINQYIYITSNDKALESEWGYIPFEGGTVKRIGRYFADDWKKIILTTDPKLIEDGVQAIDDEFLQWFVKNPSCEEVDTRKVANGVANHKLTYEYKIILPKEEPTMVDKLKEYFNNTTEEQIQKDWEEACRQTEGINSPTVDEFLEVQKQFSNQVSLEEVAERTVLNNADMRASYSMGEFGEEMFKRGAKYQQEQDKKKYSEEEVLEILDHHTSYLETFIYQYIDRHDIEVNRDWFEQFKKK